MSAASVPTGERQSTESISNKNASYRLATSGKETQAQLIPGD